MGSIIPFPHDFPPPIPSPPPPTTPPPSIPTGGGYQGGVRGGSQMTPYSPGDYRRRPYGIASILPRATMFGGGPSLGATMVGAPAQYAMAAPGAAPAPASQPGPPAQAAPAGQPGWGLLTGHQVPSQAGGMSPQDQRDYAPFSKGFYYGAQYDPNNPWGFAQADPRANYWGIINRLIGAGGQAGAYDPMGSQALVDLLTSQGQQQATANTRTALDQARASGIDPSAYGYAALQAQLGGLNAGSMAALDARTRSALANQNFLQSLVGGAQQLSNASALGNASYLQQSMLQNQNRPGWGDYLAGIAGAGIGGLASRWP